VILHTLNTGPRESAFHDCLRIATAGDAILLMGAGVYGALRSTDACSQLLKTGAEVYLLRDDAQAAGILGQLDDQIQSVDMDGFVTLSERFPRQLAWY
jgi:tRNA 2-thiouridine synthesizing protein B